MYFLKYYINWILYVLWREEGYTMKYNLSLREIPKAKPEGFPEGWGYIFYRISRVESQ